MYNKLKQNNRITCLAEDKLRKVNNLLLTGVNAIIIAREIHSWGILLAIPENRLSKMLIKYRNEQLGAIVVDKEGKTEVLIVGELQQAKFDALFELQSIAERQRNRVTALLDLEVTNKKHSSTATAEIQTYSFLLKDVLKAEFDCGVRDYLGPVGGAKALGRPVHNPEAHTIEGSVSTAVDRALEIMARNAPKIIEASLES